MPVVTAGVDALWCGSSFGQTSLAPIDMMKLAPWTALVPATLTYLPSCLTTAISLACLAALSGSSTDALTRLN